MADAAPPPLHELEAEVMDAVWGLEEASVRDVMDAVNRSAAKPRAYTTYMTILRRLHAKELLVRRREGKTDFYSPAYSRDEYADLRAQTTYMTILGRLHTKGLLERRREGKTDVYRPVHTRAEYADRRAQAEVAALVEAFGDVALGHFARQVAELDPERRAALERLARER